MTSTTVPPKQATRANQAIENIKKSTPLLKDLLTQVFGQSRILKKTYAGIMHFLIFWGMTIQILGTAINLQQMDLFIPFLELPFPRGNAYLAYELVMDLGGAAIIVGILMAAFRRAVLRPKTLETRWDDIYAIVLLLLIPIAGFTTESLRLVSTSPEWASWSPIGNAYANLLRNLGMTPGQAANIHDSFFWVHAILGLTLIASIPFTKLRHLVTTPLHILLRKREPLGALDFIENIEETETLGVGNIREFDSLQLLSFDACLNCGRCEEVCPSAISGMPYSPRMMVQNLRELMNQSLIDGNNGTAQTGEIFGGKIDSKFPWYCTTCGACLVRCPGFVNPVKEIVDLRRYQVLMTGEMEKSVGDTLRNLERQGNPWGMPPEDRMAWAEGIEVRELAPGDEVDVLWFLGCAFAYDERNKKVARSFARILEAAGIDYGVLGYDEMCCGETARRMGHEYLFQVFAEQNIETFSKIKFRRIVTQCPHCFNTLKNEYPQMGGNYEVLHYTEFLASIMPQLGHVLSNDHKSLLDDVVFHDSCYLGRYNQIYQQPRRLLETVTDNLIELPRNKENSFCCGGGGGQMWMETDAETRINHRRLEEILQSDAHNVATACPYCLIMLDDAIRSKGKGEELKLYDIAELLEQNIEIISQPKN